MRDLVTPLDLRGPWHFPVVGIANRPAMSCLTCHQMHRQGSPLIRPPAKVVFPARTQELFRPSLALFDHRELAYMPAE